MRLPEPGDTELSDAFDRYVAAWQGGRMRYMRLLHGNFSTLPEPQRAMFLDLLVDAAQRITDHELGVLLESEWRSRITAAWLVGVSRRSQFRERMGGLLLASESPFAGKGYCFALARLGTAADADILVAYLDRYLRRPDLPHDQAWVLGALQYIDVRLKTSHAGRFVRPGGLWQQWASARVRTVDHRLRIDTLCSLVDEAMLRKGVAGSGG